MLLLYSFKKVTIKLILSARSFHRPCLGPPDYWCDTQETIYCQGSNLGPAHLARPFVISLYPAHTVCFVGGAEGEEATSSCVQGLFLLYAQKWFLMILRNFMWYQGCEQDYSHCSPIQSKCLHFCILSLLTHAKMCLAMVLTRGCTSDCGTYTLGHGALQGLHSFSCNDSWLLLTGGYTLS